MSTRPPNSSTGPLDHLALLYLRQALDTAHPTDEPYVLNATECRLIRRAKALTLSAAAMLGVAGAALFYVPLYYWPDLFADTSIRLFGQAYALPLITVLYGVLLVYLEVNLLMSVNLRGARSIMEACHFPRAHDAQYEQHLRALANPLSIQADRSILRFGVNAYLTAPRWGLPLFFLINLTKATLSTLAIKLLATKLMGDHALRQVIDFVGLPVYVLWNTWSSWQVLHETQVRVMAPMTIREFVGELHDEWGKNDEFRVLVVEILDYLGILKRQTNYAHFILIETLTDRFELRPDALVAGHFEERIAQASVPMRRSLERLLVFCVLVDGKLSGFEKRQLKHLRAKGFLTSSPGNIRRIGNDYNQGRGLWV